jgi:hypothetical protein
MLRLAVPKFRHAPGREEVRSPQRFSYLTKAYTVAWLNLARGRRKFEGMSGSQKGELFDTYRTGKAVKMSPRYGSGGRRRMLFVLGFGSAECAQAPECPPRFTIASSQTSTANPQRPATPSVRREVESDQGARGEPRKATGEKTTRGSSVSPARCSSAGSRKRNS